MSAPSRFEFTDRCRPILQVGSGASSTAPSIGGRWDVSLWDDVGFAEWAGAEPTWTDASEFVQSADTTSGRVGNNTRVTDEFEVGRGVFVFDNATGWANPNMLPSPDSPRLVGGQQVRVGVDHRVFGIVWLWRGFIDDIEPVWSPTDWSTVMVRAIDPLGESGRPMLAQVTPRPDDEAASDRFAALLDAAPWVTAKRDISTVATELVEAPFDGRVLELGRRCALSAGGWVFGTANGDVAFRGASWLNSEASRAPDFVVTNDPAIAEPITVCPSGWSRPYRRRDITARVILATPPSDPETYESTSTIDDCGADTLSIRDLWTKSPTDRANIADRLLTVRGPDTVPRLESVTVHAHHAGDNRAAVDMATLISATRPSRLRCRFLDDNNAVVFDDQCFATAVQHHITSDEWTIDVALDRSDPFSVPTGPHYWDVDNWNQAQWS